MVAHLCAKYALLHMPVFCAGEFHLTSGDPMRVFICESALIQRRTNRAFVQSRALKLRGGHASTV